MSGEYYQPSDAVICAARDLRDALLQDHGMQNDRNGTEWMMRNFWSVLVLASQVTSDFRIRAETLLASETPDQRGKLP